MNAMKRSIHDNFVLGYSVDSVSKNIVIRTEYRDQGEPFERTDVHFEGVVAYLLKDALNGILVDIEETTLEVIMERHQHDFEWGKRYGWPQWPRTDAALCQFVHDKGLKVFDIQSATVFDGFVVCQSMHLKAIDNV